MKKSMLYILAFAFPFLWACKKDNTSQSSRYDLIVEGGINTYTTQQFIRLSRPASFNEENAAAISGAKVSVNDGSADIPFSEIGSSGVYTAIMNNNKNFYEPYTLTIQYKNRIYNATDTLIPVVPIDTSYIPIKAAAIGNTMRLSIPEHTFGTSSPQQWLFLQHGITWSPSDFDGIYNYAYSHLLGTPNALNPLTRSTTVIDLQPDENIDIYKFSLSNSYSSYLYNFFQETDWRGLLSSVPSNIKGNISGNANGFFYAMDIERKSFSGKSLLGR